MELSKAVIFLILSLGTACIARAQNDGAVAPDTPPARLAEVDFSRAAPAARETPDRWNWLKNTYWYVPAPNLPAFLFDADREELTPVLDQTVFHITDYRDGYFWGRTVALLQLGGVANRYVAKGLPRSAASRVELSLIVFVSLESSTDAVIQ